MKEDIQHFTNGAEKSDDITMLCVIKTKKNRSEDITLIPNEKSLQKVSDFLDNLSSKWNLSMKLTNKLQLISDEIYSNIVSYSKAQKASISVIDDSEVIKMIFNDNGKIFNPLLKPEPDVDKPLEERQIGGLGIYMVKKIASSVDYETIDGQNVLTVTFNKE